MDENGLPRHSFESKTTLCATKSDNNNDSRLLPKFMLRMILYLSFTFPVLTFFSFVFAFESYKNFENRKKYLD